MASTRNPKRAKHVEVISGAVDRSLVCDRRRRHRISIVVGVTITLSSIALLVAMSVVPPAIVLLVWRGAPPATAAEVLYAVDQSRDVRS